MDLTTAVQALIRVARDNATGDPETQALIDELQAAITGGTRTASIGLEKLVAQALGEHGTFVIRFWDDGTVKMVADSGGTWSGNTATDAVLNSLGATGRGRTNA